MIGVGKTTLLKRIADEVKNEKTFDEVAITVVSKEKNIDEIQCALILRLGLDGISYNPDKRRWAGLLIQRLADNKNKKILIILGHLWGELDLIQVGIPDPHKGLKILLTS